jgi:hypothetical protein
LDYIRDQTENDDEVNMSDKHEVAQNCGEAWHRMIWNYLIYCRRSHLYLLWTLNKLINYVHEAKLIWISRPNSMSMIVLGIPDIAELSAKFPRLLRGLASQNHIHNRRALGRFRRKFNRPTVRAFIPHVLKIHFNIIPSSTPMTSK